MFMYILDQTASLPLYEQLYNNIKNDIADGKIEAFEKLPSKRKLASYLKISVITVERAYEQLMAEGYIYSVPKKGYFSEKLPEKTKLKKIEKPQKMYDDTKAVNNKNYKYSFGTNEIDTSSFPFSKWSKLLKEVLSEKNKELLNRTNSQGIKELRKEISEYIYEFRGISASPEQILIGSGTEYLMGLIIQLIGRQKKYAVENPGYPKTYKIFKSNGVQTSLINLDNNGISVNELKNSNAEVVHITPSHHFPLGIVMPITRRRELLNWALSNNCYIIEDDYDSEFRYSGKPIPALQSLDHSNRVIYMNTFAKTLAPSFRIGYMVLPIPILQKYKEDFSFYSNTVPSFEQYTLLKFMEGGHFERHINRTRLIYKNKMEAIIKFINSSSLSDKIKIYGQNSGLHLVLKVKNGMSEEELIMTAKQNDILLHGLSEYFCNGYTDKNESTVILGYAGIEIEKIYEAFKILERIW